ncbi:hypothetical protein [uncultured Thermomonospora sp.]|uniref:hypothetical protein n=1 Tax=uncultured Thermomonospora sp. TaxID=671175 RepID=UPI00259B60D9|nr:hypothetical protein [uncultured Thermomonospora sp.]
MTAIEDVAFGSLAAVEDVHLPLTLTAVEPISHGAGTSGNTQLLRTADVILPDGRRTAVPYVSGNSLRHTLRAALAWHLVRTLQLPEKSLSKRVVDLLWSGGALTSTGNQADLELNRRVHTRLPGVGALGYSAQSDIVAGTLWVDNIHLVCQENQFRLPVHLADHPHAKLPAGAMRTETFGTRHDVAGTPVDRYIALALLDNTGELDLGTAEPLPTTQMIYDMQVIKPGAVLWSGLHLYAPTAGHVAALAVAVDEAAPEVAGHRILPLGGKRSVGFGSCRLEADLTVLGDVAELRAQYEAHLHAHREEILTLLDEVTG